MARSPSRWIEAPDEEVVDPDVTVIDPHIHLWSSGSTSYLAPDLAADAGSGHTVEGVVFVECGTAYLTTGPDGLRPAGETRFAAGQAQMMEARGDPAMIGVIGAADLRNYEDVDALLDAHEREGNGLFRGIRHSAAFDRSEAVRRSHHKPPPHLYLDQAFRRGFARLAQRGLLFEAWIYHPQLSELCDLADAFPETTIILNHLGGPLGVGPYADKRADVFREWRTWIRELARRPNMRVKLGGLAMPITGFGWHEASRPTTSEDVIAQQGDYYRAAIDVFGPDRSMFESNFPVEGEAIAYRTLWNAFKRLCEPFSSAERDAMVRETARRTYLNVGPRT